MSSASPMGIERRSFGVTHDGRRIDIYQLDNGAGLQARVMTYGGTLVSLRVPDREGTPGDVVLGFDDVESYLQPHPYLGALIGRYANRIAGGRFTLDGKPFQLNCNDGSNHLHGGMLGFDRAVWRALPRVTEAGPELTLHHVSRDGDEGYPGQLHVQVSYRLTVANELRLDYVATVERSTIVNLTNHAYFNLGNGDTVLDHRLQIAADFFLPTDDASIPTGEQRAVEGTPMDFTCLQPIGSRILAEDPQLQIAGGYDHNWVLREGRRSGTCAARLIEPISGRMLTVFTTLPGVQCYTGNLLDGGLRGRRGRNYGKHAGLCLETQQFPDAPNHLGFPSTVLRPGAAWRHSTVYRFGIVSAGGVAP